MMSGQSAAIKPNEASCRGLTARESDTIDLFYEKSFHSVAEEPLCGANLPGREIPTVKKETCRIYRGHLLIVASQTSGKVKQ